MNKWLFRAVGTVGVASGFWLLGGGGAAHAQEATAAPVTDPQALHGLLADIFSPTSGLTDLGLAVDLPGSAVDAGLDSGSPLQLRANDGRTGVTAHLPQRKDVFLGGRLPDLADSLPTVAMMPADRTEFLPALSGLTDGLTGDGGVGGLVGGLTTSGGPLNLVGGFAGGGITDELTGGLAGGALGGEDGGLLSGLTGNLAGGALGGADAKNGGLLGGLTGGDSGGLLSGLTGNLTGGLTGGDANAAQPAIAPAVDPAMQQRPAFDPALDPAFDPAAFSQTGLTNQSPTVQTSTGIPADLDPTTATQLNQATQDLVPAMIAQAMTKATQGDPAADQFDLDWDLGDDLDADALLGDDMLGDDMLGDGTVSDDMLGDMDLTGVDPALFFADNPNVDVNWVGEPEGLPVVDGLPLVGPILGDEGLGKIIVVGNIAQKLPVVGSVLDGNGLPSLDTLPVVSQVVSRGLLSDGRSAGLPVVGSLPMVGDLLGGGTGGLLGGLTGGDSGGVLGGLTGSLGGVTGGDALGGLTGGLTGGDTLGGLTGGLTGGDTLGGLTGGLTGGGSPLGGLTGGLLGAQGQPMRALPAPGMTTDMPSFAGMPAAITRLAAPSAHTARHAETDRPVAGDDTEFPSRGEESAESGLPLVGALPALSISRTLSQLPLVSDLPLVGSLPVATGVLRSLPLVGTVASLLPID